MARLMFVSHSNSDQLGKRVVAIFNNTENVFFSHTELDNPAINTLCGLTPEDVTTIKEWLMDKGSGLI